jgi:hypothetical protein
MQWRCLSEVAIYNQIPADRTGSYTNMIGSIP